MNAATATPALRPAPERLDGATAAAWSLDTADGPVPGLRAAMVTGALCGRPIPERMADLLLALLDALGWQPDYVALARAMPHMPERFDEATLQEVCARLGFPSRTARIRPADVEPMHLPALVPGPTPLLLGLDPDGSLVIDSPVSGPPPRLRTWRRRQMIFFDRPDRAARAEGSWVAGLARRLRHTVAQLLALTFVLNALTLGLSLAVMVIYDLVLPPLARDTLLALGACVALVLATDLALRRYRARLIGQLGGRVEYLLGTELFSKIVSLPLERTRTVPISSQVSRLRQFETVRELCTGGLATVLLDLPFALLFTGVLFAIAGPVGFVPLAIILGSALLAAALGPGTRRRMVEAQAARTEHRELFLDTLASLRTIRALDCQPQSVRRLDSAALVAARRGRSALERKRLIAALAATAPPLAGSATVALGAAMVMDGTLSTGALIACMMVVWRIVSPIQQALLLLPRLSDLTRLAGQIDTLMRLPAEDEGAAPAHRPARARGRLTLRRVTFQYPGTREPAIAGIDLDVQPGELLAVSGASGAGKTTLLHVMHGLLAPQAGLVALDGRNLRQLPVDEVRGAIGLAAHRPAFFHGTIAQNLRLAAPGAADRDLEAILDEFGALDLVRALPQGLETRLTEACRERLPRGTRQALMLARTFLRDAPVLLLDEPAQSLDASLERAFLGAVAARRGRTTIIMVSHRPSHIRLADRSVILDRGRILSRNGPEALSKEIAN